VPAIPGFGAYFKSTLLTIFGFDTSFEGRRQRRAVSVKANGRKILRKEPDRAPDLHGAFAEGGRGLSCDGAPPN